MFSLKNKIALVTGAGSGIGAAIALTYAKAGAFVYVLDRHAEAGAETIAQLRGEGKEAEFILADVSQEAACLQAAERVLQQKSRLDILVNNAGIGCVGTLATTRVEDLDRLYATNVRGVFNMSKAFLPSMQARKHGVIVNLASIGGVLGVRDRVAYCATKFAVVGLTKAMALDHAKEGLRVNAICPGRVNTPFVQERLREYPDPQQAYEDLSATQAMGRMGKPEEIAAAALYLASDEAAFMTGHTLLLDGGWAAGK